MDEKAIKEAVEYQKWENKGGYDAEKALRLKPVLLDLAESYLATEGKWPEKMNCPEPKGDLLTAAEGWNACLDKCKLASLKEVVTVEEIVKAIGDDSDTRGYWTKETAAAAVHALIKSKAGKGEKND